MAAPGAAVAATDPHSSRLCRFARRAASAGQSFSGEWAFPLRLSRRLCSGGVRKGFQTYSQYVRWRLDVGRQSFANFSAWVPKQEFGNQRKGFPAYGPAARRRSAIPCRRLAWRGRCREGIPDLRPGGSTWFGNPLPTARLARSASVRGSRPTARRLDVGRQSLTDDDVSAVLAKKGA
jgi:hypothetical protein